MSIAALAVLTMTATAQQPIFQPAARPGVLLLRNGQVMSGRIARSGDVYCVALPHGEIRVKAISVEFFCRTLEEGYRHKRAQVRPGNVDDHLRLAAWCLKHDLLDHAGRQLAQVRSVDPTNVLLGLLERRLQRAACPDPPTSTPAPVSTETTDPGPSIEELDRLVRAMPPGTVETFTRKIQPMLLNNCTSIGCHSLRSETSLRLMRGPTSGVPSRRVTQRNLYATLEHIDADRPMASRLLTAPSGPHGSSKTAVFSDRQSPAYATLVEWVRKVAANERTPEDAGVVAARHETAANDKDDKKAAAPAVFHQEVPFLQEAPAPKVKRGAKMPGYVPVDAFDPELFNRRFFPKR